jgi:hypothetical protein
MNAAQIIRDPAGGHIEFGDLAGSERYFIEPEVFLSFGKGKRL